MSTPEEKHADQNYRGGNDMPDNVHPMDALTATKPCVFVIDIKTIPALFHLTNLPRQKFKLALSVGHSVPKRTADRQPDAPPTNRRIYHHKTAAELHQGLKRIAICFNDRRGIFPRRFCGLTVSARRAACQSK